MKKETNRSERRAWNPILVLALALCAVFGLSALTYSWLTQSATAVPTNEEGSSFLSAQIGDFSYTVQYSFDNGSTWQNASTNGLGGVAVDYSNPAAANHISKLWFRVRQSGTMKSAVRVQYFYQWFNTVDGEDLPVQGPEITLTPSLPTGNLWHTFNDSNDDFYYYANGTTFVFPQGTDVRLAEGFSFDSVSFRAQLKIIAFVEGVQFNRYREVWGINEIPGLSS